MSYPDPALTTARNYLISKGVPGESLGIVGDRAHAATGGYHCGNDMLAEVGRLNTDYSKRQSGRDRPGSNAAMALDIGGISRAALAALVSFIIAEARAGRLPDLREIMGPHPNGGIQFFDALGIRTGASPDHDWHAHLSFFRDSEGRNKAAVFQKYYGDLPPEPPKPPVIPKQEEEETMVIVFAYAAATATQTARWGLGVVSGGEKMWFEAGSQNAANAYALRHGVNQSASVFSQTEYDVEKAKFTNA